MDGQDFEILGEMLETIENLQEQHGGDPEASYPSSARKLRREIEEFAGNCRNGTLKGRKRKRESNELFCKILRLHPS